MCKGSLAQCLPQLACVLLPRCSRRSKPRGEGPWPNWHCGVQLWRSMRDAPTQVCAHASCCRLECVPRTLPHAWSPPVVTFFFYRSFSSSTAVGRRASTCVEPTRVWYRYEKRTAWIRCIHCEPSCAPTGQHTHCAIQKGEVSVGCRQRKAPVLFMHRF